MKDMQKTYTPTRALRRIRRRARSARILRTIWWWVTGWEEHAILFITSAIPVVALISLHLIDIEPILALTLSLLPLGAAVFIFYLFGRVDPLRPESVWEWELGRIESREATFEELIELAYHPNGIVSYEARRALAEARPVGTYQMLQKLLYENSKTRAELDELCDAINSD